MITPQLYNQIESQLKRNRLIGVIIGNLAIIATIAAIILNDGWNNWLLFLFPLLIVVNYPFKSQYKVLSVLMEQTDQIDKIVLERDKSNIEIELHMIDGLNKYEVELSIKQAIETIKQLKTELPNINFEFKRGRVISGLESIAQ